MAYSYFRLWVACTLVFWGLSLLFVSGEGFLGVCFGGVGLAVSLQETAQLTARYMRKKD
jgi:hypothetical protein